MAHTKVTKTYSQNTGAANTFSYSGYFDVFKGTEVQVELDNVQLTFTASTINDSALSPREYSVDTTAKTVHIGGANLSSGTIVIRPVTDMGSPTPRATYAPGASVTSEDLNNNQLQLMRKALEYDDQKLSALGGTMTGHLTMGEDQTIIFEGATDNAHEITLTVADPSSDTTITLPNTTGTVVTTGDTGSVSVLMMAANSVDSDQYVDGSIDLVHLNTDSVDSSKIVNGSITNVDINSNAEIAVNKLANGTDNQILQSDGSGNVEWVTNVQLPGNLDVNTNTTVGGTLGITGTTTAAAINASGAVGVDGNFDVNTNKFNVAASSGDTTIAGTLGVTGNTTITGAFTANGGAAIDNIQIGVTGDNEIDTQSGNLTIDSAGGTVTVDDHLTVTGNVTTNSVNLGDDDNLNIGASEDLIIRHETTGSSDVNVLYTANNFLINKKGTSDQLAYFVPDGKAVLGYAGDDRFETTSGGAKVTGGLQITGNLTLDTSSVTLTNIENVSSGQVIVGNGSNRPTAVAMSGDVAIAAGGATTIQANSVEIGMIGCEQTSITNSDSHIPTSGAVVEYVTDALTSAGSFEVVADEDNFPATHPDPKASASVAGIAGMVVSIQNAGGLQINSSGVATNARKAGSGSDDITINGFPSSMRAGVGGNATPYELTDETGLLVTTTAQTDTAYASGAVYEFHRVFVKPADYVQLSDDINDFNNRYRIGTKTANNSNTNHDGDLFFDTGANKMYVYDGAYDAGGEWKEVTSAGDFKILTIKDHDQASGGSGPTFNNSNEEFDLFDGSADASITNAQQLIVVLNGVVQKPNAGTFSGGEEGFYLNDTHGIKFCDPPPSGSVCFVTQIGSAVSLNEPADNTVSGAKIQSGAITGGKCNNPLQFPDNHKVSFGTDSTGDLEIYHDTNAIIHNKTGQTWLQGSELYLSANHADGQEIYLKAVANGAVELYWNAERKFYTQSWGATVEDATNTNAWLQFTTQDGICGYIVGASNAGTGSEKGVIIYDASGGEKHLQAIQNGTVELYYNNVKKLNTDSWGVAITGELTATTHINIPNDTGKFMVGASNDIQIYHDGNHSYIARPSGADGQLLIRALDSENGIVMTPNGSIELHHDNIKRFETSTTGATVYPGATTDVKCNITRSSDYLSFQAYKDGTDPTGMNFQTQNDSGSSRLVGYFHEDGYLHTSPDGVYTGVANDSYGRVQPKANRYLSYEMNTHSSDPYGNLIWFKNAAPDNRTNTFLICQDSGATRLTIYSDGDVLTSDAAELTSDQTLKENIIDATSKLEDLKKIKVRNFNWKASYHPEKSKKKLLGFIAQEVEEVFPALISEHDISPGDHTKDDHTPVMKKGIKQAWAPILVKALQEAVEKIETLETKVAALEAK